MNDPRSAAPAVPDLARFFDLNLDLLCIADTEGFFRTLNPRWESILGYSIDELEGQRFLDLVHPDDLPATREAVGELAASHNVVNFANRFRHRDGTYLWLEWSSSSDGTLIYATAREMTERKRSEKRLEESEKRFRTLFDTMHEGFAFHEVICNDAGEVIDYRYLDLNPAFERLTGLKRETTVGRTVREVLPEIEEEWIQCYGRVALTGIPEERESYVRELDRYYRARAYSPEKGIFAVVFEETTAERRARREVERREALYNNLVETATDLIWRCDNEGRYTFLNRAWESAFGYAIHEMLGHRFTEFMTAEQAERDNALFSQLLITNGRVNGYETVHLRKDGTPVHLVFNATFYHDDGGKVVGTQGTAHDITERKRAEEELKERNLFIGTLLKAIPVAVFYKDRDGRFLGCNSVFSEVMGVTDEHVRGKTVFELWPGELAEKYHQMDLDLMRNGQNQTYEFQIKDKDGKIRPVIYMKDVFVDKNGEVAGLVGAFIDITERKKAEEDLQHSEERFKALSQAVFDGIIIHDQGIILECNQGLSDITGFAYSELIGMQGLDLIAPESLETVKTNIRNRYEKAYEVTGLRKDGSRYPLAIRGKQMKYQGRDVRVIEFLDITERKRLEEERLSLERQLLHAQKLESLGVLAGGIAHDFNNILTAIIGNAELAMMLLKPESPVLDNLQRIEKAAARAADLAKQMLAYSGKGKFVIEALDLNRLVEEMGHMLTVSISKKAVLRYNFSRPLPTVNADATQIRQIIMNMVINASEAIGDRSGIIAITTGCLECNEAYLQDAWLGDPIPEGLYVFMEVADTGCGMNKETLGKIFDPFFTTKFTGRGLGMAAVLGIVRGHQGAIKVYSEPGKGTTFKVLLPAGEKPAELFNRNALLDTWRGSGLALLVDDEETVRAIGNEMLRTLGFNVITATDGRDALDRYRANPDIVIIILDLTMPHMDGEQCFRELRQIAPQVKVIMSSGFSEHEVTQKFAGKGLAGFIQKPYRLSELQEVVRRALSS